MLPPRAPGRRGRQNLIVTATAIAGLAVTGGTAAAGGGGIDAPAPPRLTDVVCVESCADIRVAAPGSKVKLTGRNLAAVEVVSFNAEDSGRVRVAPVRAGDRNVTARVPDGAASGRPRVKDAYGGTATSPERLRIVAADEIPESVGFSLRSAKAKPRKAFFDGRRKPAVRYTFNGDGPTDVRVDVIDRADRSIVASFRQSGREPFTENVARWNGRTSTGKVAEKGNYRFRVGPVSGAGAETTSESRFSLRDHKFPVRARHSYGDGFGAGRNHQGQDVFARCGSRLVAARGGRVAHKATHSAAGNYVVINGRRTRLDYMYAHLQGPAKVGEGDRVRTGDVIGEVGATGNATGCHLHFEVWRGPWYDGGSPTARVTRLLKRWDSWS